MELKKMLVRLMERRGLSKAGLAYALGYRSATSVTRVMEGACGKESAGEFLQRMLSCAPLALTADERRDLLSCLDSRELGEENEGLYDAFGYLLEKTYRTCRDPAVGEFLTLMGRSAFDDCARLEIVLFNCVDEGLSWEIRQGMDRCPVTVDHYILISRSAAEIPGTVKAVLPLLHTPSYRCRVVSLPDGDARKGIFGADAALMTCVCRTGEEKQFLVFLYGKKDVRTIRLSGRVEAGDLLGGMEDVRQVNGEGVPRPEGGLDRYLAFCCDLERNRAVYQIKPCFGQEQVPTDILLGICLDGEGHVPERLKGLVPMLESREKNLLSKKKAQYHVFKEGDMRRFALTGRMSDHPAMLRAFTPSERLTILKRLEERQKNNPYFHLFFFREEDKWLDDEITLYEGAGLSIVKPGTDYSPEGPHSETLLVGPREFLETYRSFYLNRLIRTRCRDGRESAGILRSLIGEAEKLCE